MITERIKHKDPHDVRIKQPKEREWKLILVPVYPKDNSRSRYSGQPTGWRLAQAHKVGNQYVVNEKVLFP